MASDPTPDRADAPREAVRAAVEGISAIYPNTPGLIRPAAMSHVTVDEAVARILAALGVQP